MRFAAVRSLSLSKKILLPFILLLLILGLTATLGTIYLIHDSLNTSTNQHLEESRDRMLYQIKAVERHLLHDSELLTASMIDGKLDPSTFQAQSKALQLSGMVAKLLNRDDVAKIENIQLRQFIDHAIRSGKPRLRFFDQLSGEPTLALALTLTEDESSQVLFLYHPFKQAFFNPLLGSTKLDYYLFSKFGDPLLSSDPGRELPPISSETLDKAIQGISTTSNIPGERTRYILSGVPLGTTDLLLIGVAVPTKQLETLIGSLATRSVFTILIILIAGGLLFFKYLTYLTKPVEELLAATRRVSDGDLEYRLPVDPDHEGDELNQLSFSFNSMVEQLSELWQEKVSNERELTLAQEELKYKEILETKNSEIERSHQELRSSFKELTALLQLNQTMTSTLDLSVLFDRMLSVLRELFSCKLVLLLYDSGSNDLEFRKSVGIDPEVLKDVTFELDEGITGRAANTQKLVYVADIKNDNGNLNYKGRVSPRGAMASVPLVNKNRLLGVLNLHHEEVDGFNDNDLRLIQAIANQAAIAIENSQLYEKARNLSNTDELTGLANRRHFQTILQREAAQAQRFQSYFALMMIDIDHFKQYNDTHGHLKGDVVLRQVSSLLLHNTRGIDLVARFGGEEFVLLLPKTNNHGARAAAEKLRSCISQAEFEGAAESQPLGKLTISIGISVYPDDSKDVFELLDLADRALYQAKDAGRNQSIIWSDTFKNAAS